MGRHVFHLIVATLFVAMSTQAFAADKMGIKFTDEVGEVIKLLYVDPGTDRGYRLVTFTYQAVKNCPVRLSVYGHSYSKDDIQLSVFSLAMGKDNVTAGQKFRDTVQVTSEPGHYVILDKASCI